MIISDKAKEVARILQYGNKATEDRYIRSLRSRGMRVGHDVHLYSPWTIEIDVQRPWMISIGNNVHITAYCSILQHDYSWAVIQKKSGRVYGSCGEVVIGNNVFIGQKSIVLKGTTIQDNVIIGAGSVVSGTIEENSVYAGVPARKLMSLDKFEEKLASRQIDEASSLVKKYREVYGVNPPKELLREFFWIFEKRGDGPLPAAFKEVNSLNDNAGLSEERYRSSLPQFDGYEDFLSQVNAK